MMTTKQAIEIVEKTDRPYKWGGKHEHQEALQHLLTIAKRVEDTEGILKIINNSDLIGDVYRRARLAIALKRYLTGEE